MMEIEKPDYEIDILCRNCDKIVWIKIPKGITTEEYFETNPNCPRCKCEHGRNR